MKDIRIRGECFSCKRTKWFVRKRKLSIGPLKSIRITSKELICSSCYKNILQAQKEGKLM